MCIELSLLCGWYVTRLHMLAYIVVLTLLFIKNWQQSCLTPIINLTENCTLHYHVRFLLWGLTTENYYFFITEILYNQPITPSFMGYVNPSQLLFSCSSFVSLLFFIPWFPPNMVTFVWSTLCVLGKFFFSTNLPKQAISEPMSQDF